MTIKCPRILTKETIELIQNKRLRKLNAIWLEATGCSGNIISFLNGENPGLIYVLRELINFTFSNSLMTSEGENAYENFLETLKTDFILLVDGAISTKDNGKYTIIANYKGRPITALEAITLAGEKAKYVLSVGTCASYGGISAAKPNPSGSLPVSKVLKREIIKLPGCPCHPDWVIGTIASIASNNTIELDDDNRPKMFYSTTIHDLCTRRSYFDKKIFAKALGDKECMFKLGCRGPVTKTDCPTRKWNGYVNWPIGDNTPCIGCAEPYFPDSMEPFVTT